MTLTEPIDFVIEDDSIRFEFDDVEYDCQLPPIMSRFPLEDQGILIPFATKTELYANYALCFHLNEIDNTYPLLCMYLPLVASLNEAQTIALSFLAMKSAEFPYYPSVVDSQFTPVSAPDNFTPIHLSQVLYEFILNISEAFGEGVRDRVNCIISGNPRYQAIRFLSQSVLDITGNTQPETQFSQIN